MAVNIEQIQSSYRVLFIIILIGLIILIITNISLKCDNNKESWITYKRAPTNEIRTGISGNGLPGFYIVDEYRLPYDWPRGFKTTFPVPHVEPLVTLN